MNHTIFSLYYWLIPTKICEQNSFITLYHSVHYQKYWGGDRSIREEKPRVWKNRQCTLNALTPKTRAHPQYDYWKVKTTFSTKHWPFEGNKQLWSFPLPPAVPAHHGNPNRPPKPCPAGDQLPEPFIALWEQHLLQTIHLCLDALSQWYHHRHPWRRSRWCCATNLLRGAGGRPTALLQ